MRALPARGAQTQYFSSLQQLRLNAVPFGGESRCSKPPPRVLRCPVPVVVPPPRVPRAGPGGVQARVRNPHLHVLRAVRGARPQTPCCRRHRLDQAGRQVGRPPRAVRAHLDATDGVPDETFHDVPGGSSPLSGVKMFAPAPTCGPRPNGRSPVRKGAQGQPPSSRLRRAAPASTGAGGSDGGAARRAPVEVYVGCMPLAGFESLALALPPALRAPLRLHSFVLLDAGGGGVGRPRGRALRRRRSRSRASVFRRQPRPRAHPSHEMRV